MDTIVEIIESINETTTKQDLFTVQSETQQHNFMHALIECEHKEIQALLLKEMEAAIENNPTLFTTEFINQRNKDGKTPLHLACQHGLESIVEFLVKNGADVSIRDHDPKGWYPIHYAVSGTTNGHIESLIALLFRDEEDLEEEKEHREHHAQVNYTTLDTNDSPLTLAAGHAEVDMIMSITHFKPDINYQNSNGDTALHIASKVSTDPHVCFELLERGSNVNITNHEGKTAKEYALLNEHMKDDAELFEEYVHGVPENYEKYDREWDETPMEEGEYERLPSIEEDGIPYDETDHEDDQDDYEEDMTEEEHGMRDDL